MNIIDKLSIYLKPGTIDSKIPLWIKFVKLPKRWADDIDRPKIGGWYDPKSDVEGEEQIVNYIDEINSTNDDISHISFIIKHVVL